MTSFPLQIKDPAFERRGSHVTSRSSLSLLRRRILWAIHDKSKFDNLIQDLSFLIENLEKVTERLQMPSVPGLIESIHPAPDLYTHPTTQLESVKDTASDYRALDRCRYSTLITSNQIDRVVEWSSANPIPDPSNLMSSDKRSIDEQSNAEKFEAVRARLAVESASKGDGLIAPTQNNNENATGLQGHMGQNSAETLVAAKQTNSGFAFGMQGVADAESLAHIIAQQALHATSKPVTPPSSLEPKSSLESSRPSKREDQ